MLERCAARNLKTDHGRQGRRDAEAARSARRPRSGQKLTIEAGGKTRIVTLALIGAYQAANVLTAAGLVLATGGDLDDTLANLARVHPVRGRLERAVISTAGAPVYVDYAHTPDALVSAIEALRPHTQGPADRGVRRRRRPRPGQARRDGQGRGASWPISSSSPTTIRAARSRPRSAPRSWAARRSAREIGGRREAIRAALAEAEADDIILLAGKGHEQGQIVGDKVLPFDDVTVAREEAR